MAVFPALVLSCSKDEIIGIMDAGEHDGLIKITSLEQLGFESDPVTRSSYSSDYAVTFAEGDRLGLILLDAGGNRLEHEPFVYTAGEWINGELEYSPEIDKVIAYFPYNESLSESVATVDALKQSVVMMEDQSNEEDFKAMDLMVCEIGDIADENLKISFTHAFSLLTLAATSSVTVGDETFEFNVGMEDVSMSIGDKTYIPYQVNGASIWIVKDGTGLLQDDFKYTYRVMGGEKSTKTVTTTVTAAAGTCYALPAGDEGIQTGLSAGAFYCTSDRTGSAVVIPAMAADLPSGLTCHGIVFHVMDGEEFSGFATTNGLTAADYPGYEGTHGLVLSLVEGVNFGMADQDKGLLEPALTEVLNTKDVANGYKVTQLLKTAAEGNTGIVFNALNNHAEKAPGIVTDWYAPSFQELKWLIRGTAPETVTNEGRILINGQLEKVCDMQLRESVPSVTYIDENGQTGFCLIQGDGAENGWHGIPGTEIYYPICAF